MTTAAASYQVNHGASQTIDEHGVCREVSNNHGSGLAIFVPTNSLTEWEAFRTNVPSGVSLAACDPCNGSQSIGTVCADGAIYAGTSGGNQIFASRCDEGQSWSGSACTGTRLTPQWKTSNTGTAGTSSASNGVANTNSIEAAGLSSHPAAAVCREKGSQWYLPAPDEMREVWDNRGTLGYFVNIAGVGYWTSRTPANATAYVVISTNGSISNGPQKTHNHYLRCVRR